MASEEDEIPILTDRHQNFGDMSVSDLEDYVSQLEAEIQKVRDIVKKKQSAQSAADSIFKS